MSRPSARAARPTIGARRARFARRSILPLALAVLLGAAASETRAEAAKVLAPAWEALRFAPPEPGTYELPPVGDAADGAVVDSDGRRLRLHDVLGDKIAVLSFIYTACPDVNACPMATYVLTGVQRRVAEDPALREHVRLVSLSFDPANDDAAAMRAYSSHLRRDGGDWRFLTTASAEDLAPILEAYGQGVQREYDAEGRPLRTISHVLRVYLVDREKRIRNVYTSSFLHADTLWSDIRSLRLEEQAQEGGPRPPAAPAPDVDLVGRAQAPQLGLPPLPIPPDNELTRAKVELGRKLFFDRRLSHNGTMSCAMCHVPEQGFTSNEMATAVGIGGQTVRRNTPTVYNVAYLDRLFHDGRESRLEQQIWGPLLAPNEMGNPAVGHVLATIASHADYAGLFETAFDGRGPTMETVGMALASYERVLVAGDSPFDRWRFGGRADALSPAAERGFRLFAGEAGCAQCHTIADDHALFTDQQFHNTGIGYRRSMASAAVGARPLQLAPGVFVPVDPAVIGSAAEPRPSDLGRYEITLDPADRWKYRTPSLRNVALTAPYMHDGSLPTLRAVVEFYAGGGVANDGLDPRLRRLDLAPGEVDDLVAFLEALTASDVGALSASP